MVDTTMNSARGFTVLQPRKIGFLSPFVWLKKGWQDLIHSPRASLAHGLIITAMGWIVLMFTSSHLYMFTAAISGFLLVSPLMAAGVYELSRRRESGQPVTFEDSLNGLQRNGGRLTRFAGVMVLFVIAWFVISDLILNEYVGRDIPALSGAIYQTSWFSGGPQFLLTYSAVGGVVALLVFMLSVVAVPMMIDRGVAPGVAMLTSIRTVWLNIPGMLHWAVLLTLLTLVGFATQLWGMIVIIPWLGHATWHAYRETIG